MVRVLIPIVAAMLLTACGAGFDPLTYDKRNLGNSSNATVGVIDVRNASVASPEDGALHEAGDDAELTLHLVNRSPEAEVPPGIPVHAGELGAMPRVNDSESQTCGSRIGSVKKEREVTAGFAAGGAFLLLAAGAVSAFLFGRLP